MASLESKARYNEILRQTKSYRFADGLVEIEAGFLQFLLGLFIVFVTFPMPPSFLASPLEENPLYLLREIAIPAFICIYAILKVAVLPRLRRKLQQRITFPRTGYAEYEPVEKLPRSKRNIFSTLLFTSIFILLGLITLIAFISTFIFKFPKDVLFFILTFGPLLLVILLSLVSVSLAQNLAIPRFYFKAILSLVLGLSLWIFYLINNDFSYHTKNANYYGFMLGSYFVGLGVASIALGVLTLRTYLKQNPLPTKHNS